MHFYMNCQCRIGTKVISEYIESITVTKSWDDLSDSAVVRIPKRLVQEGAVDFKVGDAVSITMGYELKGKAKYYIRKVFEGVVTRINPSIPVEITCEDKAYWLKRINLVKSFKETSIKQIVDYIKTETNKIKPQSITYIGQLPSVNIDKFRIDNENGAQVLARLRKYGVVSYFREGRLYVGFPYQDDVGDISFNLSNNVVSHQLEYQNADDLNVRLIVTSKQPDNKEIRAEAGDKDGNVERVKIEHVSDQAALQEIADQRIKNMKAEGYKGHLTAFFMPYAVPMMTAEIIDPDYDRSSKHIVDKVVTTFGQGIRQRVHLGIKV